MTSHPAAPTVSIVLAVYDPPPEVLQAQLAAIAGQTSPHWECVVVDDASTSAEIAGILTAWTADDERRVLVTRSVNGGIAAATNDGIDRVSGEIVTFCDHDDVIDAAAVETLAAHFADHPGDDVVYTDEQVIDADGRVTYAYCKPDFSPRRLLGHNYFNHLTAIRRSAIGDLRLRAAYEPCQDYDFVLRVVERVLDRGRHVAHLPRTLYSWRAVAGSVALHAGQKPGVSAAVERSVRAAFERRGIDASVSAVTGNGATATCVRHAFAPADVTWDAIELAPQCDVAAIDAQLRASAADIVSFVPPDSASVEGLRALVDLVAQPGIGAAGPRLASPEGTLLSLGRMVAPTLHDPFRGAPLPIAGPWDVFLVTRDVSALAPPGLTVDRRAAVAAGGVPHDVGLDAAVAELCRRLRDAGDAVLADPSAELVVAEGLVPDPRHDVRVDDDMTIVSGRLPALRDERFSPTGTAPLRGMTPPATTELRRLIVGGGVRLVTSDVFDTIVDRPVATPSDVFVTLGRTLRERGVLPEHVSAELFAHSRRHAEHVVRRRLADAARDRHADLPAAEVEQLADVIAPECTLDEIWREMPASWGVAARVDELVDAELANEAAILRPIDSMIDTLCVAVDRGVLVHLVSDIYLSADQLRAVLRDVGVDERLLTHVSTSADHRLGKAQGLLAHTIAAHGIDPGAAVHVGDNPEADVAAARRAGATAIAADVLPHYRHVSMTPAAIVERSRVLGDDGGIRAATRAVLRDVGSLGNDPSFQFGAAVAGPAIAGFARWVAVTAERLGASTVHCLLREGATIAELMDVVAPDGPTPTLVHASRWVDMRAAVVEGTADEVMTALARRATLTPEHVAQAFDLDVEAVATVLGTHEVPHSHLPQACRRLVADDDLRRRILDASAALRERLLRYLRTALVIDDGPIVVADVGWGGTIQEGLTRVLRAAGIDNEVIGLYFALSTPGEERLRSGARMHAYLPTVVDDPDASRCSRVVSHNAEIIERILTPQLGTLVDIAADGTPVCRPDDDDHIPPTLASAQRAMAEMARRLVAQPGGLDDRFFVDDPAVRAAFAAMIADVIEAPTKPMAAALGSWPHDDVAGTAHRSISGSGLGTVVRFANAHDRDLIDWSETAWVSGIAAERNPTLAAQLVAVNRGVASGALCPASENGASSLAAFPVDSQLATLLDERDVRTGAHGWSAARIRGPVDSLRAIQFRPGTGSALVELGAFEITVVDDAGAEHTLDVDDLTDRRLRWHRAHPIDGRHLAHRADGHVVVPIDEALGARHVTVTVGFRCWPLDHGDPLARTPLHRSARAFVQRVAGAVARRLPG